MDHVNGHTPTPADGKPRCTSCEQHRPFPIVNHPGRCAWAPPPALARLYAALTAEPNTKIAYDDLFSVMPDALASGACGAFKRKVQA